MRSYRTTSNITARSGNILGNINHLIRCHYNINGVDERIKSYDLDTGEPFTILKITKEIMDEEDLWE